MRCQLLEKKKRKITQIQKAACRLKKALSKNAETKKHALKTLRK